MIQGEITMDENGNPVPTNREPTIIEERPLLGNGKDHLIHDDDEQYHEEKTDVTLVAKHDVFTRCDITIQRVETHLLDPSPISLTEMANSYVEGDVKGNDKLRTRTDSHSLESQTSATSLPDKTPQSKNELAETLIG
jgi:hypothetical protein